MKNLFLSLFILLGIHAQAQTTLCEQTYTTGNYYVFEVAIPTTGNGLPNMAPLYAYTNTIQDVWEDSCLVVLVLILFTTSMVKTQLQPV